jgi:hypothetical protein
MTDALYTYLVAECNLFNSFALCDPREEMTGPLQLQISLIRLLIS